MYDPKSLHAEQFIDNDEVLASLEYADRYCNDPAEIDGIIEKAKLCKGLTTGKHRLCWPVRCRTRCRPFSNSLKR